MEIEQWRLENIIPYGNNPRKIFADAVEKVADSIRLFGWRQPIVVDQAGVIIVGHTRLMAARKLGHETAPVQVARGLTDQQVKQYRLADNRTAEYAEWDTDKLSDEIGQVMKDLLASEEDAGLETVSERIGFPEADVLATPAGQHLARPKGEDAVFGDRELIVCPECGFEF